MMGPYPIKNEILFIKSKMKYFSVFPPSHRDIFSSKMIGLNKPMNLYQLLGISKTASQDGIKKAFYILAKKYHPDVNNSPEAVKKFKEISHAYFFKIKLDIQF